MSRPSLQETPATHDPALPDKRDAEAKSLCALLNRLPASPGATGKVWNFQHHHRKQVHVPSSTCVANVSVPNSDPRRKSGRKAGTGPATDKAGALPGRRNTRFQTFWKPLTSNPCLAARMALSSCSLKSGYCMMDRSHAGPWQFHSPSACTRTVRGMMETDGWRFPPPGSSDA